MKTFGQILDRNKGFGPGFDFARVFLAVSVLLWHVLLMSTGGYKPFIETPFWIYNYSILPMFFGLSGFLVAGSAQRNTLKIFAVNRGIRIFPALIVEIALSALILGPVFTKLPLFDYFTNPLFYIYFLNMVSLINFKLPGVFLTNPYPGTINGSLWTVPFEFLCYFVMAFIITMKFINKPKKLLACSFAIMIGAVALQTFQHFLPHVGILDKALKSYTHDGKGSALLPCFLLGAAAYTLRHKIPMDWRIFLICFGVVAFAGIFFRPESWTNTALVLVFAPILIYIVCFVGLLEIPKLPYFSRGDYSYGIYLYGFPIQQALVASSDIFRNPWIMLFGSLTATIAFATFSWHFIEKPILSKRKTITAWFSRGDATQRVDSLAVAVEAGADGFNGGEAVGRVLS